MNLSELERELKRLRAEGAHDETEVVVSAYIWAESPRPVYVKNEEVDRIIL